MRHSAMELTMKVYTHTVSSDLSVAVEKTKLTPTEDQHKSDTDSA